MFCRLIFTIDTMTTLLRTHQLASFSHRFAAELVARVDAKIIIWQ